jgi:acetyl-CoA synthetase (ADP-forming)
MTITLSEAASKEFLSRSGVPFPPEYLVSDPAAAAEAAAVLGGPVVAKLCGDAIAHKTERGLVRLGLADPEAARAAAAELLDAATPADGEVGVLVAPMLRATRELIAGIARDPQFGPTVVLGVGGVLAEAVADVVVRLVPIERTDALEMIDDLGSQALLAAFRGEPAVDREALADVVLALSAVAAGDDRVVAIDLNPLMIVDGRPIAVDALVELQDPDGGGGR